MSKLRTLVSRRVGSLRRRASMTQEEMARAANVGLDAIGRLERGEVTPSLETLQRIAQVFQMDLADFFRTNDAKAANPVLEELDALASFLATKPLEDIRFFHRMIRSTADHLDERQRSS